MSAACETCRWWGQGITKDGVILQNRKVETACYRPISSLFGVRYVDRYMPADGYCDKHTPKDPIP